MIKSSDAVALAQVGESCKAGKWRSRDNAQISVRHVQTRCGVLHLRLSKAFD